MKKSLNSTEATLESNSNALLGSTESTITNHNATGTSAPTSDGDREKSLEYVDELLQQGYKAMKENDFSQAAENFGRALEISLGWEYQEWRRTAREVAASVGAESSRFKKNDLISEE